MSHNMLLGFSLMSYGLFSVFLVLAVFILLILVIARLFPEKTETFQNNADKS